MPFCQVRRLQYQKCYTGGGPVTDFVLGPSSFKVCLWLQIIDTFTQISVSINVIDIVLSIELHFCTSREPLYALPPAVLLNTDLYSRDTFFKGFSTLGNPYLLEGSLDNTPIKKCPPAGTSSDQLLNLRKSLSKCAVSLQHFHRRN